jgi:hypothetical protein
VHIGIYKPLACIGINIKYAIYHHQVYVGINMSYIIIIPFPELIFLIRVRVGAGVRDRVGAWALGLG